MRPLVLAWLLLSGAAAPAVAQGAPTSTATPPSQVTLEQVLQLLAEPSPRTRAIRSSIAVAEADRITARTLPNPTVSYDGTHLVHGLSTGATTEHEASVDQPLLIFGQRQVRLEAASGNVKAEESRVAQALAERTAKVRAAFATLLSKQLQLQIMEDSLTNLSHVADMVRGRAAAGDRSRYDVVRVEVEMETLHMQARNGAADVEDAAGQLAVLLGLPGWSPRAVGELTTGNVPIDVESLWQVAQQRRPAVAVARQQQAAARGGFLLAERERLPVPSLTAGTQTTRDVNGTSIFGGISVPLPLFDRNQGAIAKASAEVAASNDELEATLAEGRAELESAARVLAQRRDALQAFEQSINPRLPLLRQMAEDAYREGSADILELLDANRSLRDVEITRVQQREAVKLAEEAVIAAAGLEGPAQP